MTKLQELICTKMNHDLIGNVGAVCNAVELLEDDDVEFLDDIRSILKVSSFVLSSRLKFFRACFGSSNISVEGIDEIMQNYVNTVALRNNPISVKINSFDKENLKIYLLIIMIVCDFMIKGGEINISGNSLLVKSDKFNKERLNIFMNSSQLEETSVNAGMLYLREVLFGDNKVLKIGCKDDNNLLIEVA